VTPKLNGCRGLFVLTKIEEILAWDQSAQRDRDTKFVERAAICAKGAPDNTGGSISWARLTNFSFLSLAKIGMSGLRLKSPRL
jgi:hypothetical protein